MKLLRRVDYTDYVADQAIGSDGGTVTDVPITPSEALEIEIEGKRYVLLAYATQN